jgi:3-oxoacyl-[acyl-carrier-protein] synthase II
MKAKPNREVVVTGYGTVNPLGQGVANTWKAALDGKAGISAIELFDASGLSTRIAGEIKDFNPSDRISVKDQKKIGRFIQFALAAAHEAYEEAGLNAFEMDRSRLGSFIGVGLGGLPEIESWHKVFLERGARRMTPFFIPMVIPNLASGQVSIAFDAKGPNSCTTTACSSSAHSIGDAGSLIQRGDADVMLAGGAEACISPLAIAGFGAMKALSKRNDEPAKASRPFDTGRDGFVMGEGAAILVLEEKEHALKRGAKIRAELKGYGLNGDAYHITSPAPEGEGGARCMRLAIDDAEIDASEVGYVNVHGTSTPTGDIQEALAIERVFGSHTKALSVSSTKSMTGHLLGAAGAVEALMSIRALEEQEIPPTINVENQDPQVKLDVTPNKSRKKPFNYALSNSFGFGGTNASLVFKKA